MLRATFQPPLTSPTTQSSGTNTLSRKTSLNSASPVISRSGRTSMPGEDMSTRKYVIPSCRGEPGSVRAMQIAQSACLASEVQIFCPVSRQPPSARSARVVMPARSDPAPGSLKSWHQVSWWRRVRGRNRCCCSGVP